MNRAIGVLLAMLLIGGGLGGFAYAQAPVPSLQAYHQRFQSAYVDPSIDAIANDTPLNGNYRWHLHIANDYALPALAPTIRVDSTLDPNLFPAVASWPFITSIPSLGPGERWVMMDLGSDLPVTFAPGYDSSRTMMPLEIPPGGGVQTVTVTVKPVDTRYVDSFMRVGVAGNVVPGSNLQPPGAEATINSEGQPGIVWTMHQSQPGGEYTFTVQLQVANSTGSSLVHKPAVQVYVESAEFLGETAGTSAVTADPILQGAATYSVADVRLWHRVLAEPYLVQYGGTGEPGAPGGNVEVDFTTAYRHTADGDLAVSVLNSPLEGSKETSAGIWNNSGQPVIDPVLTFIPEPGIDIEDVMRQDLVSESPYTWALPTIPVNDGLRRFAFARPEPFAFTPGFSTSRTLDRIDFAGPGPHTQRLVVSTTVEEEMLWLDILVRTYDDLVDASITGATGDGDITLLPDSRTASIRIEAPTVGATYSQTVDINVALKPGVDSASFKPRIHVDAGHETASGYVNGTSVSVTTELGTWEWTTAANYPWHWVEGLVTSVVFPEVERGPPPPVNEIDFAYHTFRVCDSPGDTFSNGPVTGTTSWASWAESRSAEEPITGPQLRLDSGLILDWHQISDVATIATLGGPPTYEWAFGDVAPEGAAGVWVRSTDPDAFPATFTPGFDATRSVDRVRFSQSDGPQTQTLTVTVTPQEAMEYLLLWVAADDNVLIPVDEDDIVEAAFVSVPEGSVVTSDGHLLLMAVPAGNIGEPVTTTITIEVAPNVPRVEYKPAVWVIAVEEATDYDVDVPVGDNHSLEVPPLGTWTWNATGEYRLTWTTAVLEAVTFSEIQSGIKSFAIETMSVDFDRRPSRDKIAISEATFSLREGAIYDLAVDDVTVMVDGVVITIPAGSFTRDDDDEGEYKFKSAKGDGPKVHMEIDFDKGEWSLKVGKLDASAIDNSDGVDVTFIIGFMVARERINMRVGGLTYIAAE